jgi:mannose-1-phosphate guanylyltransferase
MLPIMGMPMLEGVMVQLGLHGVTDAVLSLGYLPEPFLEAYPEGECAGVRLSYAVEPEPLDTAGAVRFAAEVLEPDDTFVVVNGDVLTDLDLSALVAFHKDHGGEGTIALYPVEDPSHFGVVPTNDDGQVIAFVEKPPRDEAPTNLINAGTYVFEPAVLERIPLGQRMSIERQTFPAMVADGALFAMEDRSYWLDTGTPESYLRAHADILSGHRTPAFFTGALRDGTFVVPGATVDASATVRSSVIDEGCTIEAGAVVTDSVLLPGVTVCSGAVIEGSVVGQGATIGAGSVLRPTTVIGFDVTVEDGTELANDRVPAP